MGLVQYYVALINLKLDKVKIMEDKEKTTNQARPQYKTYKHTKTATSRPNPMAVLYFDVNTLQQVYYDM